MPLISVIVPIYKTEKFLHQCVDSLLMQPFTDCEVILVDDGSPDGSPEICDIYATKDPRVQVIHQKNAGLISARISGVKMARGDYITFVDSDDFVDDGYFQALSEILRRDCPDIVAFDCHTTNGSEWKNTCDAGLYRGEDTSRITEKMIFDPTRGEMNHGCILFTVWSKCIRRELLLSCLEKVPSCIMMGEDAATVLPALARANSIYISRFSGYCYRDNPNSITNNFRVSDAKNNEILIDYLEAALGDAYRERLNVYCLDLTYEYVYAGILHFSSVSDFTKTMKENIGESTKKRIGKVSLKGFSSPRRFLFWLCRRGSYALLFTFYRNKKRKREKHGNES